MEYEAKTRERCGQCGERLEVGQYGKRGLKQYCKTCIEDPVRLIAIFSQPGEVSRSKSGGTAAAGYLPNLLIPYATRMLLSPRPTQRRRPAVAPGPSRCLSSELHPCT